MKHDMNMVCHLSYNSRSLTHSSLGDGRWLEVLNTPLLQNLLPEHVHAKALELKPELLAHAEKLPWVDDLY